MGRPKAAKDSVPSDDVGLNWVECDLCSCWEVFENSGIAGSFSASLAKKANFVCRMCVLRGKLDELTNQLNKIAALVDLTPNAQSWIDVVKANDLLSTKEEMNKILNENCSSIKYELNLIKVNLAKTSPPSTTTTLSAPQLRQATSEMLDVESRKLNLVVSGLPEGLQDTADLISFCNTYHDLPTPLLTDDIVSTVRVGGNGPLFPHRLLKIKVRTNIIKKNLLLIHQHKKSSTPPIYIRPDLTKAQQEIDKKLRDDLRLKGKDLYKISRGKIVLRSTSALSSSVPQAAALSLPLTEPKSIAKTKTSIQNNAVSIPLPYAGLPLTRKENTRNTKLMHSNTPANSSLPSTLINISNKYSALQSIDSDSADSLLVSSVDTPTVLTEVTQSAPLNIVTPIPTQSIQLAERSESTLVAGSALLPSPISTMMGCLEDDLPSTLPELKDTDVLAGWETVSTRPLKSKAVPKPAIKTV